MWASIGRVGTYGGGCVAGVFAVHQIGRHLCSAPIDQGQNKQAHAALESSGRTWVDGEALEQLATLLDIERRWKQGGEVGGEVGLRTAVRAAYGHSLTCAQSRISEEAGDGLFACGGIPRGRVLSVYGGAHACVWNGFFQRVLRSLLPSYFVHGYVLQQADGSTMDGSTESASEQRGGKGYVSPCTSCQLANHPPAGSRPNAAFLSVVVPQCTTFASLPISRWLGGELGPSVVATLLVSVVDIEDGEEVFVNYNYRPSAAPAWYIPCAAAEAEGSTREPSWHGPSMREYLIAAGYDE
eukprot:TRINITY_DN3947_c0_g2_i1.p1 TRINITY_DN3947_c0_g2~~TRINITY_DN3947_c0_g2_i1.p1  ORF type:complete len:297 (-),score=19.97 TRINITY_DN3947_c0_g2_i1:442-1332(-)